MPAMMRNPPPRLTTAAACIAMLGLAGAAWSTDYSVTDPGDADILERALFLCQWRIGNGAPDGEPTPVACTTAAISTDDAVHETKQWWTYWARFSTDAAVKAKIRFNTDFLAFQSRQRQQPALAAVLLPQGGRLSCDDWRIVLIRDLAAQAEARRQRLQHHVPAASVPGYC